MTIQIQNAPSSINIGKTGKSVTVDYAKMPQASLDHVFAYGIRQILNDARASAKTEAEAEAMTAKRLDNLMSGTLRASPVREGNPVRARALELAIAKVVRSPKFIAWAQAEGVKVSDKRAQAAARDNAKRLIEVEGNPFMAQAEKDVAEAAKINVDDLDLTF